MHCQMLGLLFLRVSETQDFLEVSDDPFMPTDRGEHCLDVTFGKIHYFD